MAQRHFLKEFLQEDQEPFHLNSYIADKRRQLKDRSPPAKTQTQLQKKKVNKVASFPTNFWKHACFLSMHDSPDARNSPLFEFWSPAVEKIPCRGSNALFLHVPAKTAALLLEAAMRIQKKRKPQIKNHGFRIFGSVLTRLTSRNRTLKREMSEPADVNGDGKAENRDGVGAGVVEKSGSETGFSNRRLSSVWSESGHKSLDFLDSSSSSGGRSEDKEQFEEVDESVNGGDSAFCLSPFRFALYEALTPDRRSSIFASPAASPSRRKLEARLQVPGEAELVTQFFRNYRPALKFEAHLSLEIQRIRKGLRAAAGNFKYEEDATGRLKAGEAEEDKEQKSPASVLDAPFADGGGGGGDDHDGYDLERRHGFPQRVKKLLQHEIKEVSKRLDSWIDVEFDTIDTMTKIDLRRETDKWRKPCREQVDRVAMELELAMLTILVEEMAEELIH
ncbi:hypothetical protein Nepgr_028173 [Nepenthes gracilis]|uniref:DUF4378 domain-containing protein n=1 Tax=Nepenthes gracilis TaxID=150966 RepID=A0AAD3T9T9_NEPGR|nr:hypothetical protein Nepgr_028173 [Nepenthes gracilis]